jgi:hypothetical protein
MEAFRGKGSYAEDPKDLPGALDEALNYRGPALVNVSLARRSALLHPAPEGSRARQLRDSRRVRLFNDRGSGHRDPRFLRDEPARGSRPPEKLLCVCWRRRYGR